MSDTHVAKASESTRPVEPAGGSMNGSQKLHFRVSCQYIDKLLSGVEDILHAAESKSPFPKYKVDVNLAQIRVLEDYIRRFRALLVSTLAWQNIDPPEPDIPATRAIVVNLSFVDVTLSDMRPSAMRGSGALSEAVAVQLSGVVHELGSLNESMMNYVQRELDQSLHDRIGALSTSTAPKLLQQLETIVTRHGLVEFRPRINMLLSGLEDQRFEIAVFGRVSSGKSSFLNAVLHTQLLPVGVNPITAVPTRISFGQEVQAEVRYGNGLPVAISLDEFRGIISERSNPGNERAVTRASLKLPSPRLVDGIVLVDTPGLGSLARRGAAETLAYLPSCDLALLLIDAATTLTDEDVATLRTIREAAIPATVLLSKCDLLDQQDVMSSIEYVERQLSDHLGQMFPVFAVSSLESEQPALDSFFEKHLRPRIGEAETLKAESIQRKLERLRSDVMTSLETRLNRQENSASTVDSSRTRSLEARLRAISGSVGDLGESLQHQALELRSRSSSILTRIVDNRVTETGSSQTIGAAALSKELRESVASEVHPMLALAQRVASEAIESTRKIGVELGRSDLPDQRELEALIREAPQFELFSLPSELSIAAWRYLGASIARSRWKATLIATLKVSLDRALEDYSQSLDQWSRFLARVLQQSVNSYLDAYRGVLQGAGGPGSQDGSSAQLRDDIRVLRDLSSHRQINEQRQGG